MRKQRGSIAANSSLPDSPEHGKLGCMVVYGLADIRRADRLGIGDVIEIYFREEDAEAALANVLSHEPSFAFQLSIVPIELPEFVAN
jgi:hypothetical protein